MADPKNFFEPQSREENCFGLLGGPGHAPPESVSKKGPRLAKNAFQECQLGKTR